MPTRIDRDEVRRLLSGGAQVSAILVTTPEGRLIGVLYRDEAEHAIQHRPHTHRT